jgi:hypothetical protein
MSRVTITKTSASLNSGSAVTEVDLSTIVGTTGASMVCGIDESIVVYAENTNATSRVLTVKAGAFNSAGIGDLEVTLAQNAPQIIGPLEGSRFAQEDGKIYLDCATGATGVIAALDLAF